VKLYSRAFPACENQPTDENIAQFVEMRNPTHSFPTGDADAAFSPTGPAQDRAFSGLETAFNNF
jgi:hypothetical protein